MLPSHMAGCHLSSLSRQEAQAGREGEEMMCAMFGCWPWWCYYARRNPKFGRNILQPAFLWGSIILAAVLMAGCRTPSVYERCYCSGESKEWNDDMAMHLVCPCPSERLEIIGGSR